MTWEETIKYIRTKPEYSELVEKAYFEEDLELNITRFGKSEEFLETLKIFEQYANDASTILDIGCGNGVSTINFALKSYEVTAVEPDPSNTIGAGAIKILKEELNLNNIEVFEDFAENISFPDNTFDIVYVRQAMHHANDLEAFVGECIRVLKPNGLFLTVRDHVVFSESDKTWFLKKHALQKYYGGENAYKPVEYKEAISNAGASLIKELKYYDSVINYFPQTEQSINCLREKRLNKQKNKLRRKLGVISNLPLVWKIYQKISGYKLLNEENIPGRMYSYIAVKR
ncbi:class I SAM-dependent methyltransferase [Psychroserpens sp.]